MKTIAHFGAFDHDSYGDLLFPYLAEYFLGNDFSLVHVAPTGIQTIWADAHKIISVEKALMYEKWDGILIGGGDIIQASPWLMGSWAKSEITAIAALPSLWMGAGILASRLSIPLAWNAPGCPSFIQAASMDLAKHCINVSEYISVRDKDSAERINNISSCQQIHVIPDSALLLRFLWPEHPREIGADYIVFEISTELLKLKFNEIRKSIEHILSLRNAKPVFLSLTPWAKGSDLYDAFATNFNDCVVISRPDSIKRTAGLIANSVGYFGNSLHGFIAAVSYGRPVVIVQPYNNHKFRGFLEVCKLNKSSEKHLFTSWEQLIKIKEMPLPMLVPDDVIEVCQRHWKSIRGVLSASCSSKTKFYSDLRDKELRAAEKLLGWGINSQYLQRQLFLSQQTLSERSSQIAGLTQVIGRINALMASQSWKLTAPLRFISTWLKALLPKRKN